MTTINQQSLLKLLAAADKLMPTKKAMREAGLLLKERKFISGEGWRHIETPLDCFKGITLEAHADGFISASVHTIVDTHIAYVSVPFTVKARVTSAFRITVDPTTLIGMVKLYDWKDTLDLSINEAGCLTLTVGRDVSHFCPIVNDTYYDVVYAEAMKPAPVVIEIVMIAALPAPACSICEQPAYRHMFFGKPVCDSCHVSIRDYDQKVQDRAERLYSRADKLTAEASAGWERAHQMADVIPFGQPILVGHHSEGRDRRYRDRIWNTQKRAYEATKEAERLAERAKAAESNRAISSDDPAAVLKLQEKLADHQAAQDRMVTINKAIRKLIPTQERMKNYGELAPKLVEITGCTLKVAESLLTPDFMGRLGYPDWQTRNNSAEIRRIKQRIEALKAQRSTVAEVTSEETHGDIRLERSAEDNRLRLHFPGKPSHLVIAQLKSNGFKWSPSNMAWQRQLNNAAEYAAQRVLTFIKEQVA